MPCGAGAGTDEDPRGVHSRNGRRTFVRRLPDANLCAAKWFCWLKHRRSRLPERSRALRLLERLAELEKSENLKEKDALKRIARERGISKSELWRELQRERARAGSRVRSNSRPAPRLLSAAPNGRPVFRGRPMFPPRITERTSRSCRPVRIDASRRNTLR